MDCYFHHAVPLVSHCSTCAKAVCAACRNDVGDCPSCVLAARIAAASASRARIAGGIGPSERNTYHDPQSVPESAGRVRTIDPATYIESDTSRTIVALGYPFWPLAVLALFDGSKSPAVRRHALQALGFNLFAYGVGFPVLSAVASIPVLGMPVWPLVAFWLPIVFVASVIYGFKAFHNERVDVPFLSSFLDSRRTA